MFDPGILIGDVLTEKDVHRIFECQTTFGIRMNKKNHAIVIVSDATSKNTYADTWVGDTLYYTGTDAGAVNGNQTLYGPGNNNGALKAVWDAPDETTIFLFEKYVTNECTYKGVVRLAKEPYTEPRKSNPEKTVWKFPLQLVAVDAEKLHNDRMITENRAALKSEEALRASIFKRKNSNKEKPSRRKAITAVYDRDPEISAYVKVRAHGKCDLCQNAAPFMDVHGQPYLESHHIEWLSKGGKDIPENMVALCPNCHRKMHVLGLNKDIAALEQKAREYLRGEL